MSLSSAMYNLSAVTPTIYIPPANPGGVSCLELEKVWDEGRGHNKYFHTTPLTTFPFLEFCQDNHCKVNKKILPNATVTFNKLAEDYCSLILDSQSPEVKASIEILQGRNVFDMLHLDTGDRIKADTDFKNFIEMHWQISDNRIQRDCSEDLCKMKSELVPTRGWIKIERNFDQDPNKITIRFVQGDQNLSGECRLGTNELACDTFDENNILSRLFRVSGKVLVTYSRKILDNGKERLTFDLSSPAYLIYPEKKLGTFELVWANGEFEASGSIASLDPGVTEPLFSGKYTCKGNMNCEGTTKLALKPEKKIEHDYQFNSFEDPNKFGMDFTQKFSFTRSGPANQTEQSTMEHAVSRGCEYSSTQDANITDCTASYRNAADNTDLISVKASLHSEESAHSNSIEGKFEDVKANKTIVAGKYSHTEDETAHRYQTHVEFQDGTEIDASLKQPK